MNDPRQIFAEEARAFGQRLALRMAELHLTRAQVAARIPGFNVASISRIVHADPPQDVLLSTVIKLATSLETRAHVLLGSQDDTTMASMVSPETAELVMVLGSLPRAWQAAVLAGVKELRRQRDLLEGAETPPE